MDGEFTKDGAKSIDEISPAETHEPELQQLVGSQPLGVPGATEQQPASGTQPAESALPDWLRLAGEQPAIPQEQPATESPSAESSLPDWLSRPRTTGRPTEQPGHGSFRRILPAGMDAAGGEHPAVPQEQPAAMAPSAESSLRMAAAAGNNRRPTSNRAEPLSAETSLPNGCRGRRTTGRPTGATAENRVC